jgi:hypothetical protein
MEASQPEKEAAAFLATRRQVPIYSCYAQNCNRTFVRIKDVKKHLKVDHQRLKRTLPTLKESESESEDNDDVEVVSVTGPLDERASEETETALAVASILPATPGIFATTSEAEETASTNPTVSTDPTVRRVPGHRDGPPRTPAARKPHVELSGIRKKLQMKVGHTIPLKKKVPQTTSSKDSPDDGHQQ